MEEPSAKRLQALLEKLDRISTRFESQQNPVLESIAEELGIATPSGSTAQCNQRLQREIRHRLDAEHMEESTA